MYVGIFAVDVPKENPKKTEMLKRVEDLKYNIAKNAKTSL